MAYFEVEPGIKLYYEQFGVGEPLIFIHGGGGSHELWEQQIFDLADDFQTITIDLRGHGISDKPSSGHTIKRFLQDIEILLKSLEIADSINFVCHGIGGYIGMLYALKNFKKTRRLVLVNSGPQFIGADKEIGGFSQELHDNILHNIAANKVEARAKLVEETFFYKDPGKYTKQAIIDTMNQWPAYAEKMLINDMKNLNLKLQLNNIQTLTLIIHGIHDEKQRFEGAKYLASKIQNSKLIPFEYSAHNPQLEEVEKFNHVLREFINN